MEKNQKKTAQTSTHRNNGKKNPHNRMSEESHSMLRSFFSDQLKDIYWAEKRMVDTLPKMAKAATTKELHDAFTEHREQTKDHVTRLEQVFDLLGEKPQAKKCEAIEGLIKEEESIIKDTKEGTSTRDVGLIVAAQKIEHYEIGTYGSLAQLARTLELEEIQNLLGTTLDEEKECDYGLTQVAETKINHMSLEEMEA